MNNDIKINLMIGGGDVLKVKIGSARLSVNENAEHLIENLYDGKCFKRMSPGEKIYSKFRQHHLDIITEEHSPKMFNLLRKVFINEDTSDFKKCALAERKAGNKKEGLVIKDETLQEILTDESLRNLLIDSGFRKLAGIPPIKKKSKISILETTKEAGTKRTNMQDSK